MTKSTFLALLAAGVLAGCMENTARFDPGKDTIGSIAEPSGGY